MLGFSTNVCPLAAASTFSFVELQQMHCHLVVIADKKVDRVPWCIFAPEQGHPTSRKWHQTLYIPKV